MELPDYIKNRYWKDYLAPGITVDLEFPEDMTFIDVFERGQKEFPDKICMDFYGIEFTFKELNILTRRFAAGLVDLGAKKGDVVALWLPNCPHFGITYFGSLYVGATMTAISPLFVARELAYQLQDSGAKYLIIIDRFIKQYQKVADNLLLEKVIVVNIEGKIPEVPEDDKIIHYNTLMEKHAEPLSDYNVDINPKEDIAVIQYTGGTTGLPKGACLSHYNIVSMIHAIEQFVLYLKEHYLKEDVAGLSVLPWYHIYGQVCELAMGPMVGGKAYVLPTFDIPKIAEIIKEHKPNMLLGVPTMFINLLNSPHIVDVDISCLKYSNVGAGALPSELAKEWEKRTGFQMAEGYGLSETSVAAIMSPPWGKKKYGSTGHPFANTLVGVIDENLNFLPIGDPGELVISGPQVMVRYHNRPEETKNVFFEAGGYRWLRTGDYAKMDDEGYTFILDRIKDMIKYKGHSVYPREIEEVLHEHPAIQECSVIGVKDPVKGEDIKAFVLLKKEYKGKVSEQDIIEFGKENLAAYKYPREVEFVRNFPKSAVGKVLRRSLREKEEKRKEKKILSVETK
ncbi:MAG: AMP-binding protein [Promethearchaeota archaeon]